MRYALLILVSACIALSPSAAEAGKKPVIYYQFDSIKGDIVKDRSGSGNDGTLVDNPEIVDGQLGMGIEFADSYVSVLASDSLSADFFQGSFTIVLWMNRQSEGKQWQAIFTSDGPPKTYDTLFLNQNGLLSWRGRVGGAWAGGMCETDPGIVSVSKWTHVVVVSDQKNFRIYVNGKLTKESDFQETDGGNVNYYLGNAPYRANKYEYGYSGIMDDFAIFAEPLRETEIKLIMEAGVESFAAVELKGKLTIKWASIKKQ